ncbi:dehydrogenase/reductase SDR family protein 7-like isoform X3 [Battus philenor]|uniref:dehydrogenase/reductase SDR family protein 7-like isoform X3 n=1 Tax=Battus philenor TaxID=42288 RepID=UPI0035CED713
MKFCETGSIAWYLQYFGLPLSLGMILYKLSNKVRFHKRKEALQGKVVVITGASSGIGEALAHVFFKYGCKLVLASRRISELERVKEDLMSKKVASKVHEMCGHVDILINNGGISHRGSILHTKFEVYKQIMNVNYLGSVGLTLATLPKMVERKSGHIVFISSVQGLISLPERSSYGASKHAVQAFGDSLRAEMKQHNIKVSMISPGYVKTSISINALTGTGKPHGVMDVSTAAGFSAEYVAMKILETVVNEENELIICQFVAHFAIFVRRMFPSLYYYIVARRAAKTT